MNDDNEKLTLTVLLPQEQDEFEKKLRETHDAVMENLAHLPKLTETYKMGDDPTPASRLGDLVHYFSPIQDRKSYARYPVFADDGEGNGHCEADWTRAAKLTHKQRREIADTMRRLAWALSSLAVNIDMHAHLLAPASRHYWL